jgi:hypothetical protein
MSVKPVDEIAKVGKARRRTPKHLRSEMGAIETETETQIHSCGRQAACTITGTASSTGNFDRPAAVAPEAAAMMSKQLTGAQQMNKMQFNYKGHNVEIAEGGWNQQVQNIKIDGKAAGYVVFPSSATERAKQIIDKLPA